MHYTVCQGNQPHRTRLGPTGHSPSGFSTGSCLDRLKNGSTPSQLQLCTWHAVMDGAIQGWDVKPGLVDSRTTDELAEQTTAPAHMICSVCVCLPRACIAPCIVIILMSTLVHHSIDARATTHHLHRIMQMQTNEREGGARREVLAED